MFDSGYWEGFLDWLRSSVIARKFISEEDFNLLRVCDHYDETSEIVQSWYTKQETVGNEALYK